LEDRRTVFQITEYAVPHRPSGGLEFAIAQVSDLHVRARERTDVLDALSIIKPDLIAVTGDLVSSGCKVVAPAERLLRGFADLAPTFYVFGNHEFAVPGIAGLERRAAAFGVEILRNRGVLLWVKEIPLWIAGVDDPRWMHDSLEAFRRNLARAVRPPPEAVCCVLLSHRPEHLEEYAKLPADVVLSGHAHGGQFRLPRIGGVFAPGQGFFPRLTAGVHRHGGLNLVISRGLGDGTLSLRLRNPRELVVVRLRPAGLRESWA
jgi:predicted MPP superfamily phosphohydrolase